ncbi:MAG: hypothetical protein V1660_01700 [archaeon]
MYKEYEGVLGKKSRPFSVIFMSLGILSALGLRLVLPLTKINPFYASVSWYSAMLLSAVFYTYRIYVEDRRQDLIINNKLREKIRSKKLSRKDLEEVNILLNSIIISKVKINYIIFLILTIIVLVVQLFIEFFLNIK